MKRIIIHWTAGGYYPTTAEKEVYHFLVDKDGKVYNGKFAPENNLKCVKGCYAAHTGGAILHQLGLQYVQWLDLRIKIPAGLILSSLCSLKQQ